jgi:acyl carrier protein
LNGAPIADEAIIQVIRSAVPRAAAESGIGPGTNLRDELGIDSIGLMSIVFVLEEQTGFDAVSHIQDLIQAEYVADIIKIVQQG